MPEKTILVGYDGSEAAERALARAAEFSQAFSAVLVVVSVTAPEPVRATVPAFEPAGPVLLPPGVAGPSATGGTVPMPAPEPGPSVDPESLARRQLDRAQMSLASRHVEAEYVAEVGEPAERLLAVAERRDADLIVVGSPAHGFLERLLGHAVDEAVARRADRDVLLVH